MKADKPSMRFFSSMKALARRTKIELREASFVVKPVARHWTQPAARGHDPSAKQSR